MKRGQTKRNRALRVNLKYKREPEQQFYFYMDLDRQKELDALFRKLKPWKHW